MAGVVVIILAVQLLALEGGDEFIAFTKGVIFEATIVLPHFDLTKYSA